MTISSHLPSAPTSATWQPQDQEAIRQALALPATVPCLDAIERAMGDLESHHPAGVISSCRWAGLTRSRQLRSSPPPGR